MKSFATTDIKKILILKWSAMGDIIIATAAMSDIRQEFPAASIDLHTTRAWAPLFEQDPRFNEVMTGEVRSLKGILRWLSDVHRGGYDLVVDLQSNDRSRYLLGLLTVIGWAPRYRVGNHPYFPYNISSGLTGVSIHAFEIQKKALVAAGFKAASERPSLYVPETSRAKVNQLCSQYGLLKDRFAIFFPGSHGAGYLKRWGAERYANLGRRLVALGIDRSALVGGPDDFEECSAIAEFCNANWLVNLCGQTHLLDIVALSQTAKLIVGNDTGTSHVASCSATPMLVICGPTDPDRVKPVGDQVFALQANGECLNCYRKECNYHIHHHCMKSISVDMVIDKLKVMKAL